MTKADLVSAVYETVGFSKKESTEIVELLFELMRKALEDQGKVKISNFGNFTRRSKKVRRGRDPQTGQAIEISARDVLSFKASNYLKKTMNS